MRVLSHHERRCRRTTSASAESSQSAPSRTINPRNLVAPPPRSTRLRDQLIEKFHHQDAELIFDIRSIRRKLNYRENLDERPRKRARREAIQCRCYLAVWDNRQGHRKPEPILKRSEDCAVTPTETTSDNHAIDIELEGPFRIPAKEFFVPIVDRNGQLSKWAVGDKYLLEIKIIPCNISQLWPPLPILSKSDDSLMRGLVKRDDLAFTEGMLVSNYSNLPHAPPEGVPLNIAFDQGGRTFKTKYGLEVNAEWTYPHLYDAKLKKEEEMMVSQREDEEKMDPLCRSIEYGQKAQTSQRRLNEPELLPLLKPTIKISYVWDIETKTAVPREFRTTSIEGLYCPVCHIQESTSLKRLQFHLCTNHEKYKFSIESKKYDTEAKRLERVIFRVEVADIVRPRAANRVKDEREFTWQRPKQPFEIEAYISGEQSWVGALPRRRTAAATASVIPHPGILTSNASSQNLTTPRTDIFRPSAKVPEIPSPDRRRFQVPKAKTRRKTSFYRSINHKAMETGEMLSETDDDIDDTWLVKRHHDTLDETEGLTRTERRFRQRWNAHIMSEGCPNTRYTSDSLIRFVRKNMTWLRGTEDEADIFAQFQDLAARLMESGVINSSILKDCLQMVRDGGNSRGRNPTPTNFDVFSLFRKATKAAVDDSGPNRGSNLQTDISEVPGETQDGDDNNDETSDVGPREPPKRTDPVKQTVYLTPASDSQSRDAISVQQPTTTEPKKHHSPATGFCGTCNNFIDQPKRRAITCSYIVSLFLSFFDLLSVRNGIPSLVLPRSYTM